MALKIHTVATSISNVAVSGVRMRDLTEIPWNLAASNVPIFFPRPNNFITDISIERDSMGTPAQAAKTFFYTLNYVYIYKAVGATRGYSFFQDMVKQVADIWDAIVLNDDMSGPIDINPGSIANFEPIPSPEGEEYWGAHLDFDVKEFIN